MHRTYTPGQREYKKYVKDIEGKCFAPLKGLLSWLKITEAF
jgi:hypothetical protein